MRIDIITVLPEMLDGFINTSILARAQKKKLVEVHVHNLRDYTTDKHRRVDDYPFGGFAGMVMQCQPIDACISKLTAERTYDQIIFTTPDGKKFDQPMANELSLSKNLIISVSYTHLRGVLSDEQSALSDSFQDNLLAAPVYTRPSDYKGWKVPEILLSGNEAKIKEWELQQSYERTKRLRPDLLESTDLNG